MQVAPVGARGTTTVSSLIKNLVAALCAATAILSLHLSGHGVLAMAAKYADDKPALIRFMRDMGYPKIGRWCGEFAASIIARAGGTPPAGAAVASNWRSYGTADATPHVGDVAVADRGVPTGELGSHIGFVTDIDLEHATFTLESGNARNIYTTRKISCFSFRRPPDTVLSALTGNGVPKGAAVADAPTGLPLDRTGSAAAPLAAAMSSAADDCSQEDGP